MEGWEFPYLIFKFILPRESQCISVWRRSVWCASSSHSCTNICLLSGQDLIKLTIFTTVFKVSFSSSQRCLLASACLHIMLWNTMQWGAFSFKWLLGHLFFPIIEAAPYVQHATKLLRGRLCFVSTTLKISCPLMVVVRLTDVRMSCFSKVSSMYCTYTISIASSATAVVSSNRIENGHHLEFFYCAQLFLPFYRFCLSPCCWTVVQS